jgi:phosphoribosylformimino-5-aminoimidazole carboxamide ribotide isomerase
MRVIPVIDLLNGFAVHAVKGDRKNYPPLQSILCNQPDPITIARSFQTQLGLGEIYVADLNSIQYHDNLRHRRLISALASNESMDIILDAGVSAFEDAIAWMNTGVRKVVIGAETLQAITAIDQIPKQLDGNRIVFSLDLRAGKILSQCRELAAMSPIEALDRLQSAGWREVILLDLIRVGSGTGIDRALVEEARHQVPGLNLLVGGGIACAEQLEDLRKTGVAGVLLATALHSGIITARHISGIHELGDRNGCAPHNAGHG